LLQSSVVLCKAFPGTRPWELVIESGFFDNNPEFVESLTGRDIFMLNLLALAEHNRRREKADKEAEEEREDKRAKPGLVKRMGREEQIERYKKRKAEKELVGCG